MTISEIIQEIHKERVELEVCQALQQWLLEDRKEWIDRAMESEATVRAIQNIATRTTSPKGAIEGIISLCTEWVDMKIPCEKCYLRYSSYCIGCIYQSFGIGKRG